MSTDKYLLLYRTPAGPSNYEPSPEEMQAMFAQWSAWKEQFKTEILDIGDGLKPGGGVLKSGVLTEGPFVEAKEVMGGFSIIATASFERAVEVARGCPMNLMPGASIEIRPMAGF